MVPLGFVVISIDSVLFTSRLFISSTIAYRTNQTTPQDFAIWSHTGFPCLSLSPLPSTVHSKETLLSHFKWSVFPPNRYKVATQLLTRLCPEKHVTSWKHVVDVLSIANLLTQHHHLETPGTVPVYPLWSWGWPRSAAPWLCSALWKYFPTHQEPGKDKNLKYIF